MTESNVENVGNFALQGFLGIQKDWLSLGNLSYLGERMRQQHYGLTDNNVKGCENRA